MKIRIPSCEATSIAINRKLLAIGSRGKLWIWYRAHDSSSPVLGQVPKVLRINWQGLSITRIRLYGSEILTCDETGTCGLVDYTKHEYSGDIETDAFICLSIQDVRYIRVGGRLRISAFSDDGQGIFSTKDWGMKKPLVECNGYRDCDSECLDISEGGDLLLKNNTDGFLRILDLSREHPRYYHPGMHGTYLGRFLARKSMYVYIEEYDGPCLSIHRYKDINSDDNEVFSWRRVSKQRGLSRWISDMNTYRDKVVLAIPTGAIVFDISRESLAHLAGLLGTHHKAFETQNPAIECSRRFGKVQSSIEEKLTGKKKPK